VLATDSRISMLTIRAAPRPAATDPAQEGTNHGR